VGARLILADFYAQSGKPDKSIEVLQKIVQEQPGEAAAQRRLANLFFDRKDLDKASQLASEALKKNPDDAEAGLVKGRVLLAENKPDEAVIEFQSLLKRRPTLAAARYFLATAYVQLRENQKAETELKNVVQSSPNSFQAYATLASLDLTNGNSGAAIR